MLGVSDASVLASEVDQTIIVVQHRRFPRAMLTRVKQAIVGVGGTVLGVVLNNVDLKHDQNYYYYTNYYGYYQPRDKEQLAAAAKSRGTHRQQRLLPTWTNTNAIPCHCLLVLLRRQHRFGSVRRFCASAIPIEFKIGGVPCEEQTQVNNIYTVDSNGMINLPYINKVQAEGLSPSQLAAAIEGHISRGQDFHESDDHDRDAATRRVS